MRVYDCIDHMWWDALLEIQLSGKDIPSRDGTTREVIGYCAQLLRPDLCWLHSPGRSLDPAYAMAEIAWYMSGSTEVGWMAKFAPQYSRFADDGKAHGGYGGRLFRLGIDQVTYVIELLRRDPDSRQAVIAMWDLQDLPHAVAADRKDLPCTLNLQFLRRSGRLHLIATMRSNDIWLGMPYDVFWFCTLQRIVASELGIEMGYYHHRAGSLHLYSRDVTKASLCREFDGDSIESWMGLPHSLQNIKDTASALINDEELSPIGPISQAMSILCREGDVETIDTPLRLAVKHRRLKNDRAGGPGHGGKDDSGE